MREYKFRGKRTENGEWVYGYYIKAKGHWHNRGIHEDWIICNAMQNGGWFALGAKYPVITETVGQFTGLRDKNGKEIYEGDILDEKGYNFTVVFDPKWAKFKLQHDGKVIQYPEWNRGVCMEVIGNIHDNPELLKGDRE